MTAPEPRRTISFADVVVNGRLVVPTLTLSPGVTVVVGSNGAGKSTLLDLAAGVLRPEQGVVRSNGVDVATLAPRARAARLASLAQEPPRLDDVSVSARIGQGLAPRQGANVRLDAKSRAAIATVAEELGVQGLLSRRLGSLSGGERRRVHVARVLVDDAADAVIIDEPFAGLDQASSGLLVTALKRRAARQIVVVSVHDIAVALALSGRLLGLAAGAIVTDGPLPEALHGAAAVWGDVKIVSDGDYVGVLRRR